MYIEEVWKEKARFEDVLLLINVDLHQTAKSLVQLLNQDMLSVKDSFRAWIQASIDKLIQAAKFEPQELHKVVKIVEENKNDE